MVAMKKTSMRMKSSMLKKASGGQLKGPRKPISPTRPTKKLASSKLKKATGGRLVEPKRPTRPTRPIENNIASSKLKKVVGGKKPIQKKKVINKQKIVLPLKLKKASGGLYGLSSKISSKGGRGGGSRGGSGGGRGAAKLKSIVGGRYSNSKLGYQKAAKSKMPERLKLINRRY